MMPPDCGNSAAAMATDAATSRITCNTKAQDAASPVSHVVAGGRRLPLHSPSDATYLSPLVCLMRSQLEVFSATQADVEARVSYGKLVQKIGVGRVGIRCVHCRDRPASEQAKGATSYPASIRVLNQATRNWQRFHWVACKFIPPSAREEFDRLTSGGKKANSSRKSQEYWIRRSGEMGLVDTAACAATTTIALSSPAERTVEPKGIYFEEDAKKLGLRILMPPPEGKAATTRKCNGAAAKTKKKKKNATHARHPDNNKRKNVLVSNNINDAIDGSQNSTSGHGHISSENEMSDQQQHVQGSASTSDFDPLMVFPAMGKDFSVGDLGDDASLMSDLERLVGEDDDNEAGDATGGSDDAICFGGIVHRQSRSSTYTQPHGLNVGTAAPIHDTSMSERNLKLLSTLRAAQELVRSLREKYPDENLSSTESQLASDLHSLGKALYMSLEDEGNTLAEVTLGNVISMAEDADVGERLPKRERRRNGENQRMHNTIPLQDLGYPTAVSIFVQSLIDATNEDAAERFTSLSDVDSDLRLMIEFSDKYLFDASPEASTGRLDLSSELYGIKMQRNKLINAFQSVVVTGEERHGLALISGRSGSGKTSLVETLVYPLREQRGRLIEIKFDKKDNHSVPSIFRALDQYCHELQGDLDLLNEVGAAVKTALGPSSPILLSLMPNLSGLVGEMTSTLPTIDNKEKYHLLLSCVQIFIRTISAPSHPIVILYDDLQWADPESLALITKIVKDPETRSCLFVGCYRDNEVLTDHPLLEYLGQIAFAGVPMWQIFQESISKGSINDLLSDTLHLMPRITAPLARELHKKTGGNPYFAKQLLHSLYEDRLLQYSPSARRWHWDIGAVRSKNVPDSAVALLLERMNQYGPSVQRVLQIAALMGRRFDASALQIFQAGGDAGGDGSAILAHIDTVVDDGLICIDKAELRFAHDSIWEAALSLTPVFERERMNLLIGRRMLHAASNDCASLDIHLRLIVDQMNSGSSLIQTYDEKLRLAELNLQVGRQALATNSFLEASMYLLQGSALLSEESWDSNYRLCLEIFTACAEAQLAYGNNDGAIISASAVISHGRCLNDKLSSHFATCVALHTQGKIENACHTAICVLDELGIRLPSLETRIETATIRSELMKTEKKILSLCPKDIMARPIMPKESGETTSLIMRILLTLCQMFYLTKPDFLPLVVFRMVQITMESPMTSEASFAFAAHSNILCKLGLRDRSAACAQMALSLLDRFHGKYSYVVSLVLNVSIWPYRQPWHACLDSFERASRDATAIGDFSNAHACLVFASAMHIFVPAESLQVAKTTLEDHLRVVKSYENHNVFIPTIYLQMTLNLITSDACGDPTILQGDATGQNDVLSMLPQSMMYYAPRALRKVDFARLYLGYVFRRHEVVLEFASNVKERLMKNRNDMYPAFELLLEKFYLGLAAYSIIRRGSNAKSEDWQITGDDLLNEMKALSEKDSEWNFQQKYLLLEAENAFTDGNVEVATASYDKAIESAKAHRFINEQALASECAGLFHLDHENAGQARRYLEQARDLYGEWGAQRKVDDIEGLLATL